MKNSLIFPYIVPALLLTGLILLAYQEAPLNDFHFDDELNITRHSPVRMDSLSLENLKLAATQGFMPTRPLPNVSFAIDWWRSQGQAASFQWTNICLHIFTAMCLTGFIGIVLSRTTGHEKTLTVMLAFAAAALWALHPIQVQAVTYIVQRMTIMATLFSLLSMSAFVLALEAPAGLKRYLYAGLCLISGLAAALSKENAWILPGLWLLAYFGICRHNKPLCRSTWDYVLLSLPVLGLAWLVLDLSLFHGPLADYLSPAYEQRAFSMAERLYTQPRVILFHASQILYPLPSRFSLEHDFSLSTGLLSPASTLWAILAILIWCGTGLKCLFNQAQRVIGFWILWVPVTLFIESSVVALEMVFEHRFYLPLVGLAGLIAHGSAKLLGNRPGGKIPVIAAFVLLSATLGYLTCLRLPVWQTNTSLYEQALRTAPGSSRVWANLGMFYYKDGEPLKAEAHLRQALELDENNADALEHLAVMKMDRNELSSAYELLNRALNIHGKDVPPSLLNHLGELSLKMNDYLRAEYYFSQAQRNQPRNPVYLWNLAITYEHLDRCPQSEHYWTEYLQHETDGREQQVVREHLREEYHSAGGKCFQH